jgi:hypothetical protein
MAFIVQTVSTGDVIVFDKERRDLILIDREYTGDWEAMKDKSPNSAMAFVKDGRAKQFSREELGKIQAALAGVVLLV